MDENSRFMIAFAKATDMENPRCSETFDELRDLLGEDAAYRIIGAIGGRCVYVPKKWRADCEIFKLLTEEYGKAFSQQYGGSHCYIPRAQFAGRNRTKYIEKLLNEGIAINNISTLARCMKDGSEKLKNVINPLPTLHKVKTKRN